jgi:hypothetical protein
MDQVDTYVAYDQICRRRIGEVLEVFADNPAVVKPPRPLVHRPTENGIQIYDAGGYLTVFVRYLIPAEQFTTFPYIPSRTYLRGDVIYVPDQGECYQAIRLAFEKDPATETAYWRRCQFPEVLAEYVKAGAFCDTLRESDTSDERDPVMLQIRGQRAALADAQAEDEINRQINRLQAQGQSYRYLPFGVVVRQAGRRSAFSIPGYVLQGGGAYDYGPIMPTGTGTTTISDQCETEWGYIPPLPVVPTPQVVWEYHEDIISETGPEPSVAGVTTLGKAPKSVIYAVSLPDQGRSYRLEVGTKDPADPGQIEPHDYHPDTNPRYWQRIS